LAPRALDRSAGTEASGAYALDMPRPDTAYVAGLFADRSRVAMIDVLMDSREHAVGALASAAGIAASTATEHLSRLEDGGVVVVRRTGRQRLVQLAGPSVAAAYEALAELSDEREANGLRAWTRREQLRAARTCYDHLAGRLGVAIADAALAADAVERDFSLGRCARTWFGELGVDLEALPRGRRPLLRVCIDWTERREHLAGALGAAICLAVLDAGWAVRQPSSRALRLTSRGETELGSLGIALTNTEALQARRASV
jgi:DNA-binding transcriptional ArsR family regulator